MTGRSEESSSLSQLESKRVFMTRRRSPATLSTACGEKTPKVSCYAILCVSWSHLRCAGSSRTCIWCPYRPGRFYFAVFRIHIQISRNPRSYRTSHGSCTHRRRPRPISRSLVRYPLVAGRKARPPGSRLHIQPYNICQGMGT